MLYRGHDTCARDSDWMMNSLIMTYSVAVASISVQYWDVIMYLLTGRPTTGCGTDTIRTVAECLGELLGPFVTMEGHLIVIGAHRPYTCINITSSYIRRGGRTVSARTVIFMIPRITTNSRALGTRTVRRTNRRRGHMTSHTV